MTRPGWAEARNVLAVRLDAAGDVLMTTPALRALKEPFPGRRLTLLTSPAGASVARLVPEIDDVVVYEAPWMKSSAPAADGRRDHDTIGLLRGGNFDAAAIFTVYSQNPLPAALLCHLAGIPLRLAHCRENPYQLLTHWVRDTEPVGAVRHEVRRQLDLAAAVGGRATHERMSLRVPSRARGKIRARLAARRLDGGRPWIAVHPGASASSRRWPPEHFAAAARLLHREQGLVSVFTGGPGEVELVESIRREAGVPSHSLAGDLGLEELAALLELAPLVVANNTGPAHMAAALGTPVVDLYALTNPQHTPWGAPSRVLFHDVPCKYCHRSVCPEGHHRCLRLVPPEAVAQAVRSLLEETASPAYKSWEDPTTCIPWASTPSITIRPPAS
jgi:lipopolysaccharide heptosyltransferase II